VVARVTVLVCVGLVAGFFSGLFGVGGGVLIVPLLVAFAGYPPKGAMATSLAAILFTASAGAIAHSTNGDVAWKDAALIGIPAVGGAVLGAELHQRLESKWLVLGFSAFLCAVAVKLAV